MYCSRRRTVHGVRSGTLSLARNCAAIFVAVGTSLRRKKLCTHVLKADFVKSSYNVVRRSLPTSAGRFRDGVDSTPSVALASFLTLYTVLELTPSRSATVSQASATLGYGFRCRTLK
ncbi:hypothetical protein MTO96_022408 [Rhipicephalus appendiculatus]